MVTSASGNAPMRSWACLIEYMQQTREQSRLSTVQSREPVQRTKAMFDGAFPSEGRTTALNGRVGDRIRSICIAVITFGYSPKPYSGFLFGSKS